MAFVQVIEFRTSHIDEIRVVAEEWETATEGKRTARRRVLCRGSRRPRALLQYRVLRLIRRRDGELRAARDRCAFVEDDGFRGRPSDLLQPGRGGRQRVVSSHACVKRHMVMEPGG